MDRRVLIFGIAFGLATGSLAADSQQRGKIWRIAVLTADRPGAVEALLDGLRELHYVEGKNLVLERRRFTREEQLPTIASELVRLSPDVIVAGSGVVALALKAATKTVPIVMAESTDAVGQGVVASLGRPGENITGFTDMAPDLTAKRLEILQGNRGAGIAYCSAGMPSQL